MFGKSCPLIYNLADSCTGLKNSFMTLNVFDVEKLYLFSNFRSRTSVSPVRRFNGEPCSVSSSKSLRRKNQNIDFTGISGTSCNFTVSSPNSVSIDGCFLTTSVINTCCLVVKNVFSCADTVISSVITLNLSNVRCDQLGLFVKNVAGLNFISNSSFCLWIAHVGKYGLL